MPVHPGAAGVDQDRAARTRSDRSVDGPADGRRQRDQDNLGALAAHAQHSVAVFLAEVGDVCSGGLEDPQAQQAEHETVEGRNRRISCIHRMYSSRCGRCADSGSRPRSAHQDR